MKTRSRPGDVRPIPDLQLNAYLVGHGYQIDILFDVGGELVGQGSECWDFSDNHDVADLRVSLAGALLAQVARWRETPTKGVVNRRRRAKGVSK